MLTAFGPFVSVYLAGQGWNQAHLQLTLSVGTAASIISQIPTGTLVDVLRPKQATAALGILGAGASALLFSVWPAHWPVMLAGSVADFRLAPYQRVIGGTAAMGQNDDRV